MNAGVRIHYGCDLDQLLLNQFGLGVPLSGCGCRWDPCGPMVGQL